VTTSDWATGGTKHYDYQGCGGEKSSGRIERATDLAPVHFISLSRSHLAHRTQQLACAALHKHAHCLAAPAAASAASHLSEFDLLLQSAAWSTRRAA
jgi:hypothetical protein